MKILVIGGNRFFGKKLVRNLLRAGHEVTLLNRGNLEDGFGVGIERIKCDRIDNDAMKKSLGRKTWDVVYDQACYEANEAESAIEIFKDKTEKYIFTSSQSVYDSGTHIKEEVFNPLEYSFNEIADKNKNYAEAKRQCEAVFFKNETLPVTAVRFPIVVGEDDYTKRFHFHIEKILKREPIYFSNIDAKISFISSEDAAVALEFLAGRKIQGPINVASEQPLVLRNLINEMEDVVKAKADLATQVDEKNLSPYNIKNDWFMDVQKLKSMGFCCRPIRDWLTDEIKAAI